MKPFFTIFLAGGCSKISSSALQGRWREATEGSHVHKDILYVCVSVGVPPPSGPLGRLPYKAEQFLFAGFATPSKERRDSFAIRMENKRVVTTPPHGKQKGRYDPQKNRMS